jgi:hypothetical protein
MTELHVATNGPLVKELVNDVIAFIRQNENYWANQAATLYSGDPETNRKVADAAIYEVWTDIMDHLQVDFATTLATHGVDS